MRLHASDLNTFTACPQKWHYSSLQRLGLEPKVQYLPFFFGSATHYAIQEYFENDTPMQEALDEWILNLPPEQMHLLSDSSSSYYEAMAELRTILLHYELWLEATADDHWGVNNIEFLSLEPEFEVPLTSDLTMGGRWDGFIRRKDDGTFWIWEIKTTKNINDRKKSFTLENQTSHYLLAAEKALGQPIEGIVYLLVKKRPPVTPEILKNGTLQKRKNMATSKEWYRQAIETVHPDWTPRQILQEYGEILTVLSQRDPFFEMVEVFRTPYQLEQYRQKIIFIGNTMIDKDFVPYPYPGWFNCNYCAFEAPCKARQTESPEAEQAILNREFKSRQGWNALEGNEFTL